MRKYITVSIILAIGVIAAISHYKKIKKERKCRSTVWGFYNDRGNWVFDSVKGHFGKEYDNCEDTIINQVRVTKSLLELSALQKSKQN